MRKPIAVLAAAALLLALGVAFAATAGASDPAVRTATTRTVVLGDNFFKPRTLRVRKNDIVRFLWGPGNEGTDVEHNVTGAKGNRFASEDTARPDAPYRRRITRTTNVICTIHPTTMTMKITVVP